MHIIQPLVNTNVLNVFFSFFFLFAFDTFKSDSQLTSPATLLCSQCFSAPPPLLSSASMSLSPFANWMGSRPNWLVSPTECCSKITRKIELIKFSLCLSFTFIRSLALITSSCIVYCIFHFFFQVWFCYCCQSFVTSSIASNILLAMPSLFLYSNLG